MEKKTNDRSCYTCRAFILCYLRHRVWDAIQAPGMLNIDSNDAPGKVADILFALGNACMMYTKKPKKKGC
jgi:hypothetical protein